MAANSTNISSEGSPAEEQQSYDITGKNWVEVVETLNSIVNRKDYKTGALFDIMITPTSRHLRQYPKCFQKIFQLKAQPGSQPGNGILSIWQDGQFIARPYDKEMVKDLKEMYDSDTSAFARHLKTLFQKNETIAKYPFVTSELYMLMLFEIGRRLVKDSTNEFDKLPIKEAIQGILVLLGEKKCTFDDVFLKGGKFHCFSGSVKERKKAVKEIKEAVKEIKEAVKKIKEAVKEIKEAVKKSKEALSSDEEGETESENEGSLPPQFESSLKL